LEGDLEAGQDIFPANTDSAILLELSNLKVRNLGMECNIDGKGALTHSVPTARTCLQAWIIYRCFLPKGTVFIYGLR
jgi:hypothetical protein